MALGIGSPRSDVMNLVQNARKLGETEELGYTRTDYDIDGDGKRDVVISAKKQPDPVFGNNTQVQTFDAQGRPVDFYRFDNFLGPESYHRWDHTRVASQEHNDFFEDGSVKQVRELAHGADLRVYARETLEWGPSDVRQTKSHTTERDDDGDGTLEHKGTREKTWEYRPTVGQSYIRK